MFYLKHNGEILEIGNDNVYTLCPECGQEHAVDLAEILSTGEADLCSTKVYCPECSEHRQKSETAIPQHEPCLRAVDTETGETVYLERAVFDIACPDCGKGHEIDLDDIIVAACRDCTGLEGICVRCEDCAASRAESKATKS